jgi:hypothetical protein
MTQGEPLTMNNGVLGLVAVRLQSIFWILSLIMDLTKTVKLSHGW